MKKLLLSLLAACALTLPVLCRAADDDYHWDEFPATKMTDKAALQRGAKIFVNYCLNCHSAAFMRYNRLQDIGITEQQIKDLLDPAKLTNLDPSKYK